MNLFLSRDVARPEFGERFPAKLFFTSNMVKTWAGRLLRFLYR